MNRADSGRTELTPGIAVMVGCLLCANVSLAQTELGRENLGEKFSAIAMAISMDHDSVIIGGEGAARFNPSLKENDSLLQVWSFSKLQWQWSPKGHEKFVTCVSTSSNSSVFASGGEDKRIFVWDLEKRNQLAALDGHEDRVRSLAFHPHKKEKKLISSSFDKTIRIWNYETRKLVTKISTADSYGTVVFSGDGAHVIAGDDEGNIAIWDSISYKQLKVIPAHTRRIRAIVNSPDQKQFATASLDGGIKIWEPGTYKEISSIMLKSNRVTSIAFSPDSKRLVTGGFAGNIEIFDLPNARHTDSILKLSWPVNGIVFSKNSDTFLTADFKGSLVKWKLK
jgi:WD40 repeat protein